MKEFETVQGFVPSRNDCAHLAAASREPAVHAALLRHLSEVEASTQALLKWETKTSSVPACSPLMPKPRAAHRTSVPND
jgi:hypothetical protein